VVLDKKPTGDTEYGPKGWGKKSSGAGYSKKEAVEWVEKKGGDKSDAKKPLVYSGGGCLVFG